MTKTEYDYVNGTAIRRKHWEDTTKKYTEYNSSGVQTLQRDYNAQENADLNQRIANENQEIMEAKTEAENTAILTAISETAKPPANGTAWVQPTGAHNAYMINSTVTYSGKTWLSLVDYNVWQPGVANWREQTSGSNPIWIQPTGAHDAYDIPARVSHNGFNWQTQINDNVWEPGVYGWAKV